MRKVHERFPNNVDAGTLYAEALFVLEPRRGWRDIRLPNVQRILGVLEDVLAIDSRHVGACDLYIHLTEATTEPARAEACADSIGNAIPGASHINHMPSHTWNRLGRWGDSVRANIQAWHSDQKAAIGEASRSIHRTTCTCCCMRRAWMAKAQSPCKPPRTTTKWPAITSIRFSRGSGLAASTRSSR